MLKIGFADYYLENWHCSNYPQFLRQAIAEGGYGAAVTHAYGMHDSPGGVTNSEWCEKHEVKECKSMEELVDSVDAVMVIAADDSTTHEEVSRLPLSSGNPCFVDKTFAYDLAAAKRMVSLAEAHGTPVFSSSALRYCSDIAKFKEDFPGRPVFVSTVGPHSLDRYAVHQLDPIEKLMGSGIKRIKAFGAGDGVTQLILDYGGGRWASFMQTPQPWAEFNFMATQDGCGMNGRRLASVNSDYYPNLMRKILDFFFTGVSPVDIRETLEIVAVIETARKARLDPDVWYDIEV